MSAVLSKRLAWAAITFALTANPTLAADKKDDKPKKTSGITKMLREYKSGIPWLEPKIVDPGPVGGPPADAIVLFDGKDLSQWEGGDKWVVADGVATVKGTSITSKQAFGSCQLHVEWASPLAVKGSGQGRGNSGIFLQGLYEIQVLDSYDNTTYFDGQAGGLYKQRPPLVNVCRKPGEWQTFDIIFDAPKFGDGRKLVEPGYVTVLQNGVLVQNHTKIEGATSWIMAPTYTAHAAKLPLQLQNHGNPVQYRNIWIRELPEEKIPTKPADDDPQADSPSAAGTK